MNLKQAKNLFEEIVEICYEMDNPLIIEVLEPIYRDVLTANDIGKVITSAAELQLHISEMDLLPEEEGIYLRLTNHYYDKEKSIPEDINPLLRKLRLTAYRDMVDGILEEFFILVNGNWIHKYCDKTLGKYHKNAE